MTSPTLCSRPTRLLNAAVTKWLVTCTLVSSFPTMAQTTSPEAAKRGAGSKLPPTMVAVAFSKTYFRLETHTLYGGFLQHVEKCAALQFVNSRAEPVARGFDAVDLLTETELLDGIKQGKVQLALVTAGLVPVVMDTTDAVPFAVRGNTTDNKIHSYKLNLIVRTDSPYRKPSDLQGKTIAHTTPGSNSGNLAPRAYFPDLGLKPDTDYKVVYSKGHERSVMGVLHGFHEGAAVASDQFQRLATKGEIRKGSFRILWESPPFPAEAWTLSRSVPQTVQDKIMRCTGTYRFPANVSKLLEGADVFLPINAGRDYAPVRFVAERSKIAP